MTSTLSPPHRPAPRRVAALTRLLVAVVAGAAAVLVLAVLRDGPGAPAAAGPAAQLDQAAVAPAAQLDQAAVAPSGQLDQPVSSSGQLDQAVAAPVDGLVAGPSSRPDRQWSERDGVLQRDCSAVHGCGPWYDTSYAPGEAPPMDSLPQLPVLDAARVG